MTGIICKYVLGEMVSLWDIWILLLTTFSTVWSLCRSVWCFWEQPSLRQLNFDMHDSSKCPFDKQFSQSLFVLTNSLRSSKDFFKNLKQFISLWFLWHNQHLMLLCGICSSFSSPLSFCSLGSLSFLWTYFWRMLFIWRLIGVFSVFGNSWIATTSTNGLKYTFNWLSNQLIKFKVPSVKLAFFVFVSSTKVSCLSTKRSMKESIGSRNFVAENVSNSLVLIFSTVF